MASSRRDFMLAGGVALSSLAARRVMAAPAERYTLCAFSKHFQWAGIGEMAGLAADLGYGGIDLTVRPGGHVLPERVEDDLPKADEAIRKAGLKLAMITSNIVDAETKNAESVVKTLASLGVRHYRWGGFLYDAKRPIPAQLTEFRARVNGLAALNKQYGVCAMYHTHSGVGQVGASIWDLYLLLQDLDPSAVSVNYDIGHATVEGGYGGWVHSARLTMPYMRGVALKDFKWQQNSRGEWEPGWCGLGQGMVNFKQFLPMLKAANFAGPLQLHFEYPELGAAHAGSRTLDIPKEKFLALMRRDITLLQRMLGDAGMA